METSQSQSRRLETSGQSLQRPSPKLSDRCQILAKRGFLTARNVTSSLVLVVYAEDFQLGVLLHLPPICGQRSPATIEDESFVKSALAMILSEFQTLGVNKRDLKTYAIGGSACGDAVGANEFLVRTALWRHGLNLTSGDLGGDQARSIWVDVASGRTIVRSEPIDPESYAQQVSGLPAAC